MDDKELEIIKLNLFNKKISVRKKMAIKIAKEKISSCGDELFKSYINEREVPIEKSWEAQKYMITALGIIKYEKVLPILLENMKYNNIIGGAIITSSALAYVRILRKSKQDITPIMKLYETKNINIILGATESLVYDEIIPSENDINKLISFFNDNENFIHESKTPGATDPRALLLAATANWNQDLPLIQEFIEKCSRLDWCINLGCIDKIKKKKKIFTEF